MPWFRVDDNLSDHPKVLAAGNAAMGLWVRAGAWSMKHLTDGFIPAPVAALLGSPREASALVRSGLWLAVDGGYQFHAWEGRQPTKREVEERRKERSEAGRRGGLKSGASRREAKREAVGEAVASAELQPVAKLTATPSRPVPSPTQIDDGDTHKPGTKVDARVGETGSDEAFVREAAAVLGIKNLDRVRAAFAPLVGASPAEAVDLARALLELSSTHVRYPEAYIEKTCVASPEQVLLVWGQLPRPGVAA